MIHLIVAVDVGIVVLLVTALRHACAPPGTVTRRRWWRRWLHRPRHAHIDVASIPAAYLIGPTREHSTEVLIDLGLIPAHTGGIS